MGQSFGPQADSLSRHRDRYGATERNFSDSRNTRFVYEAHVMSVVRSRASSVRVRPRPSVCPSVSVRQRVYEPHT